MNLGETLETEAVLIFTEIVMLTVAVGIGTLLLQAVERGTQGQKERNEI